MDKKNYNVNIIAVKKNTNINNIATFILFPMVKTLVVACELIYSEPES